MSNINTENKYGATIVIVGNVVRPAEDKFVGEKGEHTELSIAVSRNYQKDGEWASSPAVYYTLIASGTHAAPLKTVGTGDTVRVDDAQFEIREYDKKDGGKGTVNELRFGTLTVVKRKGDGAPAAAAPATADTW
jgi:single-stranded DNA-binding protein